MFADSGIVKNFNPGGQTLMSFATYGSAPYFQSLLQSQLAKSDNMVFFI